MITLAKRLMSKATTGGLPYVEFISSTAMTITPKYTNTGVTLQFSLDATNWTTITSGATTPSANIIYFRGEATGTKALFTADTTTLNTWTFTGASNLQILGKLDRLIQDSLGGNSDIMTVGDYCFAVIFYSASSLISVDIDILPATTVGAYSYAGMFDSCTSLVTTPMLPATTFTGVACYRRMFRATAISALPNLPTLTLTTACYQDMASYCLNIKVNTALGGIYDTPYRIPTTGTGTTATNALLNMFTGTGGTFRSTPTINTTYYTENTPV